MRNSKVKEVIIVDDDPDYIDLVGRALSVCQPLCSLKAISNGDNLWKWLKTSSRPNLILLDINMPGSSGLDVLKTLKTVDQYKAIPVLMLTVSDRKQDVLTSYDMGANGYIQKPEIFAELVTCMKLMTRYWFDFGSTPGKDWFNLN